MNANPKVVVVVVLAALVLLAAGGLYWYQSKPPSGEVDASRIVRAAWAYAGDTRAKGRPVPAWVTLRELIAGGFLAAADVSGFDGVEVSVNLHADPKRPTDVLLRARMPGGVELVTLADGTVQQTSKP